MLEFATLGRRKQRPYNSDTTEESNDKLFDTCNSDSVPAGAGIRGSLLKVCLWIRPSSAGKYTGTSGSVCDRSRCDGGLVLPLVALDALLRTEPPLCIRRRQSFAYRGRVCTLSVREDHCARMVRILSNSDRDNLGGAVLIEHSRVELPPSSGRRAGLWRTGRLGLGLGDPALPS